jgi:hypothetical protein
MNFWTCCGHANRAAKGGGTTLHKQQYSLHVAILLARRATQLPCCVDAASRSCCETVPHELLDMLRPRESRFEGRRDDAS